MAKLILITGGSRSGKSAFAQQMAEDISGDRLFIATCPHTDPEMDERIRRHVKDRQGRGWQSVEEPLHPEQVFTRCASGTTVLLDCLTLWVNNVMYDHEKSNKKIDDDVMATLAEELAKAALTSSGTVIMVTGEVGLGIVPDNPLARRYRDLVGRCNQVIARCADRVYLVSCGIPIQIK
jgi:adenosylcobinamide kinase/adenosylcobinamide-phosphate guanylyltransferase